MRYLALTLLLAACAPRTYGVAQLWPQPSPQNPQLIYTYDTLTVWDDEAPQRSTNTERTSSTAFENGLDCAGRLFANSIEEQRPNGTVNYAGLQCHDARGFGHIASVHPTTLVRTTYSMKIKLPARVRVGDTWSGTHGDPPHTRWCEAVPTPFCSQGLATECLSVKPTSTVYLRQHWCKDTGWVGMEGVLTGKSTMTIWTEQATRNGHIVPYVPIGKRPLPTTADIKRRAALGAK